MEAHTESPSGLMQAGATRLALMSLLPVLVALAACSGSAPSRGVVTPVVTISAVESADAADARAGLQFTVRAQPAPATDLTVSVTVAADGCAVTQSPASLTILAGADQAVFTVLTSSLEADAGGNCTVTAALAAGEGYQVGAAASANATVMPELVTPVDQPVVTIAADASPVAEGATASWTLNANPAPTTALTVNLTWTPSGDFLSGTRPQTVTIPVAGTATVSVDTVDDGTDEPDGSVTLRVAAGSGYSVGTPSTALITVTDDDGAALPAVTIRAGSPASITEGATASWTLSVAPAPTTALTVNLAWTQSGDFLPETRPQTVTIPVAGTATVSVNTVDDGTDEPDGTVTLRVAAGSGYSVGTPSTALITVTDDDGAALPVVTIRASNPTNIEEGQRASWTLSVAPAPTAALTVNLAWTQSGSFLPRSRPQTVTIPVAGTATVSVNTVDDSTDEPNGSVTLRVAVGSGYTVGASSTATVTVSDNDAGLPVVTISGNSTSIGEGATASWTLTANPAPMTPLRVDLAMSTTVTVQTTSRPSMVTMPVSGTAIVSVDTVDNDTKDNFGFVTLVIQSGTGYTIGPPSGVTIWVDDND